MAEQNGIFSGQQDQQPQSQSPTASEEQATNVNSFDDQLKKITSVDGRQKYDSVEKALEALEASQQYIPTLKSEKEQLEAEVNKLREELAQRQGVQEVVDQLSQHQQNGQEGADHSEAPLGEEQVVNLLNATLTKREQELKLQENVNKVDQALRGKFGDKVIEAVTEKAKSLNTTPEQLGKLAETSPDLVLSLFGSTPSVSTTSTSFNIHANGPKEVTLQKPEKSLLNGASTRDQVEYMRKVRESIYQKYGIEQ